MPVTAGIAMIPAPVPVALVAAIIVPAPPVAAVIIPAGMTSIAITAGIATVPAIVPVALVAVVIIPARIVAIAVPVTAPVPAVMSARLTVAPAIAASGSGRRVTALATGFAVIAAAPVSRFPSFPVGACLAAVGIAIAVAAFLPLGVRRRGHRQCGRQKNEGDKGGAKQMMLAWCHGTRLRVYAGTDPTRLTEG